MLLYIVRPLGTGIVDLLLHSLLVTQHMRTCNHHCFMISHILRVDTRHRMLEPGISPFHLLDELLRLLEVLQLDSGTPVRSIRFGIIQPRIDRGARISDNALVLTLSEAVL